jgi:hypothetical protein
MNGAPKPVRITSDWSLSPILTFGRFGFPLRFSPGEKEFPPSVEVATMRKGSRSGEPAGASG